MGPHNACSYADLAMTRIDHKILNHDDRPKDLVFPPEWSRFWMIALFPGLEAMMTLFVYGLFEFS